MKPFTLGILKEAKDHRTPLTPAHCQEITTHYPNTKIMVQPATHRCYTDQEYTNAGCKITENLADCDLLMGVKEVLINNLLAEKSYIFFSHTAKKQAHNKELLRTLLQKKIHTIDYEYLTNDDGVRTVAFGHFAGVVGAYNGLLAWGKRTKNFDLPPAHTYTDYLSLQKKIETMNFGAVKIAVTGNGRVAKGAMELLNFAGIAQISNDEYLNKPQPKAVFTQVQTAQLYERITDQGYERREFFGAPELYQSAFGAYTKTTDLLVNCMFWHEKSPRLFELNDMAQPEFSIKTIADVSCDINGSVPATSRATTIAEPVMGYHAQMGGEIAPYQPQSIDIMAVDNLPCELPKSASEEFSAQLMAHFIPFLMAQGFQSPSILRASITKNGALCPNFGYLQNYVDSLS